MRAKYARKISKTIWFACFLRRFVGQKMHVFTEF